VKRLVGPAILSLALLGTSFAAGKGPDIRIIDNRVSIQAEAVPLARLLRLLDEATGMTSKVPPELANRNISVRVSDVKLTDAVHKIFEGLPLDYVLLEGKAIIVTAASQQTAVAENNAAPYNPPPPPQENAFVEENAPFVPPPMNNNPAMNAFPPVNNPAMNQGMNPAMNPNPNQQPAMIQTPFGQIPNPRANQQPVQQNVAPTVIPGQVPPPNPFNSTLPGFNGNSNLPNLQTAPSFGTTPGVYPGVAPGAVYPGTTSPRPNP